MKQTITRRTLLRGIAAGPVTVALPPLAVMFDDNGRVFAADRAAVEPRFVFWFNGNGVPEKYWIPTDTGTDFALTPCLAPLAPFRDDIHIVTGLDNAATRLPGPGNGHTNSMSGILCGRPFTGRGGGGPSIDQMIAAKVGGGSRFRSIQVGVAQESFGESMQRNMSWAGQNRPLPPEMLPHRLFDRLFGQRELGWIARQKSVLDVVRADAADIKMVLGTSDRDRLDEHLSSVRELELAITSLPPEYKRVDPPDHDGDLKDWPRIAKLQSDLLVHAFASRQTRVASYMLTKCQSLTRFPWLGHTVLRHHDYTHSDRVPGTGYPSAKALGEICRWHIEELAYLMARLKAVPEGDGTLLDHSTILFVHEHAEGGEHKNTGHSVVVAGRSGGLRAGRHTRVMGTFGDLYLTVANDVMKAGLTDVPTATQKIDGLWNA